MPIAAVPAYLGKDFKDASPALRFGMLLPIWTTRADQERDVNKRAQARSREGQEVADMLNRQGMDATIHALCVRRRNPLPGPWDKNDFGAREAWEKVISMTENDRLRMGGLIERQKAMATTVHPDARLCLDALATAPFTTGLGNEHPLENGFAFLNPYGLPYLPGSGVKGVLRQAARELASGEWGDTLGWCMDKHYVLETDEGKTRIPLSIIDVLFGLESGEGEKQHVRGALSFWDVIPQIAGDRLMVEVMTPHQSHYYQQKAQAGSANPHDSGQPNPIGFLTVPPGSGFTFHVVCDVAHLARLTHRRPSGAPDLLAEGETHWKTLLEAAFHHAFHWLGFGAKTAVGYGAMERVVPAAPGQTSSNPQAGRRPTHPHSPWVDQQLAQLCGKGNVKPDDALRGAKLAEVVRAIEDSALRAQALADIVVRWKDKGWWERPSGGAAKKAKAIYDELLKVSSENRSDA